MEAERIVRESSSYRMPGASRSENVRMDLNENERGCSPRVLEALRRMTVHDVAAYPEYGRLEKEIALFNGINTKSVMLTNGGDDAIRCIFDTYVGRGCKVVIPSPTFTLYEILASLKGARIVRVLYNDDFSFPSNAVLESIGRKPRMIVIVNPGNPTGTSLKEKELRAILERTDESIILLDETYCHFAGKSYIGLIRKHENLIVVHSFSKAYGLAGLRLGFIAADMRRMDSIRKTYLPFGASSAAVIAGKAAFRDRSHLKSSIGEVNREKKLLCRRLGELGFYVRTTDANFLLINLGDSCRRISEELERRGILIKCLDMHPLLRGYARVSVSCRGQNLKLLRELGTFQISRDCANKIKTYWRH